MTARSRRLAIVALGLLGALLIVALAAPLLAPYAPRERSGPPFASPSVAHPLGTNDVGHDLLAELVYGARVSLLVGLVAAVVATVLGTLVGLLAGYLRGWPDNVLMRVVDVVLALPMLPLAIVVGVFVGPGLTAQVAVIASVTWAGVARELRAQTMSLAERDHIQVLRAMGARAGYLLVRHLLPLVGPLVLPRFVLAVRSAIVLQASLSFLGLGDLSLPSWGNTLSVAHARGAFLTSAWLWWVIPPGFAIALTVLAFALLGYALEERARPVLAKQAHRRASDRDTQRHRQPKEQPISSVAVAPLVVDRLSVEYPGASAPALREVSLRVCAGELLGLAGESGSGKSTLAGMVAGLPQAGAVITGGQILVQGTDVTTLYPEQWRGRRGRHVALVPQEALSALNPVRTIGWQLGETITAHGRLSRDRVPARVAELLELVGLNADLARAYPHQLSGGMRQRVAIAVALANEPAVLIADEPTSGLDMLTQAAVLQLINELRHRLEMAVLVISHDLLALERVADRIAVLRKGELVEVEAAGRILAAPRHPYTQRLVAATPRLVPPDHARSGISSPNEARGAAGEVRS